MLKRKHIKKLVYVSVSMSIVSIFLLNEAIQTAFITYHDQDSNLHRALIAESDLNQQHARVHKDRDRSVHIDQSLFQFEGYGFSYPAGCGVPNTKSIWKEVVPRPVFILSAFYDNRGLTTYVRMIAAIRTDSHHDLWCHFIGSNGSTSVKVRFDEMSENHNLHFGGWILICEVPEYTSLACEIILSTSQSSSSIKSAMSLSVVMTINDEHRLTKKRFAVCVPPVFGNFHVRKLVEFFEMMHLLGADRVFVYVFTENLWIRRVLKYYQEKRYAVLLPWYLPFSDVITKNVTAKKRNHTIQISSIWYNGQLLAANDCLYRTMPYFDFTLFSDLDEFLVPKSGWYNWEEVVVELPEKDISGYSFSSAYFKPNKVDKLISLGSLRTSNFISTRNKVMVHSKRVLDVGIHHISRSVENQNKYKTYHVPDNVAFIHHFRLCQKERNLNCSKTEVDDTVSKKYKNNIVQAVATALKEIERVY